MPDNNHIPDSGKVNEPPKAGNTEPIKADPPVEEQPAPVKTEPPAVEDAAKTAPPPAAEKPPEDKEISGSTAEQPAPVREDVPKLHIDFNIDFEQFTGGLDIVTIAA